MRRSICYTEPNAALAGQTSNWKFIYTPSTNLPKGAKLKFDLLSQGRPIDWETPTTNLKEKGNVIWMQPPQGKVVQAKQISPFQFEFILPTEVQAGETITIHMGDRNKGDEKNGNTSQHNVQRRRPFHLFIDPKGKGDYKDQETFQIDVRGNKLKNLRIITPSLINRNKRFDVIVRFEDKFGNLTSNAPEGTLIDLSYEHLRENLNWKLFIPETGFITLPNLYFNEPGIYKIKLHNLTSNETFFSPPIKCFADTDLSVFWGLLHGESERFDSTENIESCLRHFRDEKAFHFFATSHFDSESETTPDIWKSTSQQIAEFNEDDRFVALLGFQWVGDAGEEGVRQFIYTKDNKFIFRKKDTKTNSLKKIYKIFLAKDLISIPSFSMGKSTAFNFEDFNPEFERVVEIYNAWGSSECSSKENNLRPIKNGSKKGIAESHEGAIQKALNANCRFGFVAGGLDDRGIYSDLYDSNQVQYSPGLTAILAKDHTRSSLLEALHSRSCYATTGKRIILGLYIAGAPIGSELNTGAKPGLEFNRHITGYAIGTTPLKEVILIRNGEIIKTFKPTEFKFDFTFDDSDIISKIAFKSKDERPPFIYYYLRVIQEDGHIAWSSPIWVDITIAPPIVPPKKIKKRP